MSLPPELQAFTGRLLAVRNSNPSLTSDVARGISEITERYAYAYTVPATAGLHYPAMVTGATRALGMVAKYKRTPNSSLKLGRNFASIAGTTDGIGERLALVVDLDIEQAAQVIEGLVGRAHAVNFYELVELLTFWDTGDLERDMKTRSHLVYDFYSRPDNTTKKAS
ncbi:hypothetical protein E3T55_17635 [Cryobacterium frigoriphilum]|uniref:Type I-E CRISPR-associated protein Cse2/CasB n=1 Tax=Cryobacterium frigoriphilum TaxID=1259150 RepID=A0A4R8ZU31_9MICO|nr:hypothetical protein [Cryobacterium frigoriphilum]TFD45937.1 hypothetical protein E3T55_17635 [Cryobacterium frigoriphilum]